MLCILIHFYTLCFTGSPCYNVSYSNYLSIWLYCIVIHTLYVHNISYMETHDLLLYEVSTVWDNKIILKWCIFKVMWLKYIYITSDMRVSPLGNSMSRNENNHCQLIFEPRIFNWKQWSKAWKYRSVSLKH